MLHSRSNASLPLMAGWCLGVVFFAAPAFASGGHSSDSPPAAVTSGPATSETMPAEPEEDMTTCVRGKMWDKRHKRCVSMRKGELTDEDTADYAYALAKSERYDEALQVLDLMDNRNTAEALNYRGYATRKLGRTDEGIGLYLQAIALDPAYPKVREYLGEAYVIKGRLDLANEQLATIKTLCGTDCEPYRDLSAAITKMPSP